MRSIWGLFQIRLVDKRTNERVLKVRSVFRLFAPWIRHQGQIVFYATRATMNAVDWSLFWQQISRKTKTNWEGIPNPYGFPCPTFQWPAKVKWFVLEPNRCHIRAQLDDSFPFVHFYFRAKSKLDAELRWFRYLFIVIHGGAVEYFFFFFKCEFNSSITQPSTRGSWWIIAN